MATSRPPSIRELAKQLGVSRATVACALNGSGRVAAPTAERIRTAADRLGYKRNPMVGALMSALRRSQRSTLQGVLAVAEIAEPDRPDHGPFHRELLAGCRAAAEALGFKLESYAIEPKGLTPERLSSVLKARGIRGLVLLPSWQTPEFGRFDWSSFAGVYADYIPEKPRLNSVCSDHYRSMVELLATLHARGYRRPGLVMDVGRDERLHSRWSASFTSSPAGLRPVKPLYRPEIVPSDVMAWLRREKPDVVLSHHPEVLEALLAANLRVPRDVGFVGLNLAKAKRRCAALDLRPRQIGACAVELLVGQLWRQAWGMPAVPTNTTVLGEFIDGPTVRRSAARRT